MNTPSATDGGLGSWMRKHIEDARTRLILQTIVALVLIGTFTVKMFQSFGAAVETLALVLIFAYACFVLITASAAFYPIAARATQSEATAAFRAQKNARSGMFILITIGIVISVFALNVVRPLWPEVVFEVSYLQLRLNRIGFHEF